MRGAGVFNARPNTSAIRSAPNKLDACSRIVGQGSGIVRAASKRICGQDWSQHIPALCLAVAGHLGSVVIFLGCWILGLQWKREGILRPWHCI